LNKFLKYTAAFTLVLALIALNGVVYFHHHECHEGTSAQDNPCQACIIHKSIQSFESTDSSPFITPVYVQTGTVIIESEAPASEYFNYNSGRAPPTV
jgi:hypothetical protein